MTAAGSNGGAAAPTHIETDVLVIGAGGAGMYAALEAARAGAAVVLADRSLIGRGGATVMAQMTVAAALGQQTPDHWEHHLSDTLAAGRGLCDQRLAALLCEDGPRRLREMDDWKVGWAREDGHIKRRRRPATIAPVAPMSIFSPLVPRYRARCARS
jgi:succinate dehydrogenase / fumarate reductase, flavoprotein subunit